MDMEHPTLWAPWRLSYLQGLGSTDPSADQEDASCFLCEASRAGLSDQDAAERLVLARDSRGTLLLNRYPYSNGHLLAAPLDHLADLGDLTSRQRTGLMDLADLACRLLRAVLNPQGINIGMNLGRCAGAGMPGHVHLHVVPRWHGDVNFMQVVGGVRVIPQALSDSFQALRAKVGAVEGGSAGGS